MEIFGQELKEGDAVFIKTTKGEKIVGFVLEPKSRFIRSWWYIFSGFRLPELIISFGDDKKGFLKKEVVSIKKLDLGD